MRCASFANAAGFSRSAKIEEFQEGGGEEEGEGGEGEGEEERGDKITPSVAGATVRVIGVII